MALDEEWVHSLVEQREPETPGLEFKRQPYATDDRGRKEFASDVASFANAHGGTLLIGMDEDAEGRAREIVPLTGSEDVEKQRIDQWLARQVIPRLQSYSVVTIAVEGGFVMAIQIPQQFTGPFQASHGTWTRFPIRTGVITTDMDYAQLANAFGQRSRIAADLREWRSSRLQLLQSGLGTRINNQSWGFLHVMPLSSFADRRRVDWSGVRDEGFSFRQYSGSTRFNVDGLITTMAPTQSQQPRTEYIQFFRNGCIEHGWHVGTMKADAPYVRGIRSAGILHDSIPKIARAMRSVDLDGSVAMGLSLINILGKKLEDYSLQGGFVFDAHSEPFPESGIELEEDVFPDLSALADTPRHLPRLFTDVSRAFGLDVCQYFDDTGAIHPNFARYLA